MCRVLQQQGFGEEFFSFFSLITGFAISAPSSQPGKELVSCWQVKASLKRHGLINEEIAWGEMKLLSHKTLFSSAAVWEAEGELEGGGMGRQAETATEEERKGRNK